MHAPTTDSLWRGLSIRQPGMLTSTRVRSAGDDPLMDSATFRKHGHELVDWIAEYLEHPEQYPVLAQVKPRRDRVRAAGPRAGRRRAVRSDHGRLRARPRARPDALEPSGLLRLLRDHRERRPACSRSFCRPRSISRRCSGARRRPRRSSRRVALGWLRKLMGLRDAFEGVIFDTASIGTMHALVAAREAGAVPGSGAEGLTGARPRAGGPRLLLRSGAFLDRQGDDRDRPRPPLASPHSVGRELSPSTRCARRCDRRGSRGGCPADCRGRDRRHDVDDERRSGRGDRGHLRAGAAVAARRRRVRRRRRDAARLTRTSSTASNGPTRSSSTRTSGSSRRSI